MIGPLLTNKTRIKLLLKFFLNPNNTGYLRSLSEEFDESTNAIRIELNRFEEAGILQSSIEGNKKIYRANCHHPLFPDISSIIRKYVGIDTLAEEVLAELGDIEEVYLTGKLAQGLDSDVIHLFIVGSKIDQSFLDYLIQKAHHLIERKIYYLIASPNNAESILKETPNALLIYKTETLGESD